MFNENNTISGGLNFSLKNLTDQKNYYNNMTYMNIKNNNI